jgi:hypothetical protein
MSVEANTKFLEFCLNRFQLFTGKWVVVVVDVGAQLLV